MELELVTTSLNSGIDRLADFASDDESLPETSSDTDDEGNNRDDSQQKKYLLNNTSKATRWLRYTAIERAVADGLQLVDATDLTKHVLNSHGVAARQYSAGISLKKPWIPRGEWVGGWIPRRQWTAWPKKPEHVPRRLDQTWASSFIKKEPWRPGKDLEEAVFALMLRKGREQWDNREPAKSVDKEKINDIISGTPDLARIPEAGPSASASVSQKRKYHEIDEPVFCADDDRQWRVLGPLVKSTLSKLDSLLMALHQSKGKTRVYRRYATNKDSKTGLGKDNQSKRQEQTSSVSEADVEPTATDTEAMDSSASNSESDDTESTASEVEVHKRQKRGYTFQRDNPRDWSQILGYASMIGIPPEVISRTATRCAAAFNEGISFQSLDEKDPTTKLQKQTTFLPEDLLNGPPSEHRLGRTNEIRNTMELITWNLDTDRKCPFPGCDWDVSEQYLKQNLEQDSKAMINWTRKRLREHLKRSHKVEHPESNSIEILKTKHGAVHLDGFMEPIEAQPGWRGRDRSKSQSENRGGSRPGSGRPRKHPLVRWRTLPVRSVETDNEDLDMIDPALS